MYRNHVMGLKQVVCLKYCEREIKRNVKKRIQKRWFVYLNRLSNLCYKSRRELQVFNSPFCEDDNLGVGIYNVGIQSTQMKKQKQHDEQVLFEITRRVPSECVFVSLPFDFDIQSNGNQVLCSWPVHSSFITHCKHN